MQIYHCGIYNMLFLLWTFTSHLESYPVQVSRSSLPLLLVAPRWEALHHDLEVHVCGPRVLHHDVAEGDGAAPRAWAWTPHVENTATLSVTQLGPEEEEEMKQQQNYLDSESILVVSHISFRI